MMKHIVFVIGNYKNGGVPMRSTNLANEFAKNSYDVDILVTGEIADDVFFTRAEGVKLVSLKEFSSFCKNDAEVNKIKRKQEKKIGLLKKWRYVTKSFPAPDRKAENAIREIRKGEAMLPYAVKHQNSIYITFGVEYFDMTFCATKLFGSKVIYAERNAPEVDFPKDDKKRQQLLKLLKNASGAVLQTHAELEFFGDTFKNAVVIRNPVKPDLPEPHIGERRKVVVNFCRIAEQKNLPLMIEAFRKLHEIYPGYSLEIYGNTVTENEDNIKQKLLDMIEKLGAADYIKILPPRQDVHDVIRDCTMFVSSSDFEGLSNSMIEAMAIGLPCVCTDCLGGGAREMISHEENGLLVPMKDVDVLYLAMKRMIEDDELRERCSKNAAKIRETLSAENIAKQWIEYIESVT